MQRRGDAASQVRRLSGVLATVILHADLDAFYASIAQRDDPRLRGQPVIVAGSSRRAVVLTASYEARAFGVHSAMPLFMARELCPRAIVVPPDFAKYRAVHESVFAIFKAHARAVEGLSLDEAFLDLGDVTVPAALLLGRRIKDDVLGTAGITVSVGIATGKMLAKIASDDGKPDGLVAVAPGTEASYLAPKPVRRLWGIGPKTEARLRAQGIERIGDLASLPDERLVALFGAWGVELRNLAWGIDPRPVVEEWETRSISTEETFEHDVTGKARLGDVLASQAREVAQRLRSQGLLAQTVGVKVKLANRDVRGRQTSFVEPVDDAPTIERAARYCLERIALDKPVRLLGVRATNLRAGDKRQTEFFDALGT
jgi:DNA polymerase-4